MITVPQLRVWYGYADGSTYVDRTEPVLLCMRHVVLIFFLQITTVPLFAGLAASFIMSVLAILLTRAIPRPHRVHASPSTIGLLQWSHALGALDAPANAKQNDLRRTGMETEWDGLGGLTEPARLRPSTRLDEGDKSTLCESEV